MYPMNNQISLCIRSVWSDSSLSAWRNFAFLAAVHRLIWIFTGHMFEATFSDVLFPVLCCAVPFVLFLSKVNKVLLENKIFKKKIQNKNLTTYLCLLAKSPFCVFFFGDQEVAALSPSRCGNILSWRLIMKYFLQSFSPFLWFKKGSCQFLVKKCAQVLVNRLED